MNERIGGAYDYDDATIRRFRSQLKTLLGKFRDNIITNATLRGGYDVEMAIETTDNAIGFLKRYM